MIRPTTGRLFRCGPGSIGLRNSLGSVTWSVRVCRLTSVRMAAGGATGCTTGPRGISPNHCSTSARVRVMSMSPAMTRLGLFGT